MPITAKTHEEHDHDERIYCRQALIGVIVQLSAWASGPSKTITASARRGLYPPALRYWKTNKYDIAPTVILTQASVISVFAFLFILIPGINKAFLLLVTATAIIYIAVYVLMAIGIIRMCSTHPGLERPFRIGNKTAGNGLLWTVVVVFLLAIVASTGATLWYQGLGNALILIAITAVLTVAPLIMVRSRKGSWRTEVNDALRSSGGAAAESALSTAEAQATPDWVSAETGSSDADLLDRQPVTTRGV